jgi:hypothetical protein
MCYRALWVQQVVKIRPARADGLKFFFKFLLSTRELIKPSYDQGQQTLTFTSLRTISWAAFTAHWFLLRDSDGN